MWEKADFKGFEVWVMPVLAYGPPADDTPYHYVGYVCHTGADVRMADQRTQFFELAKLFATALRLVKPHTRRDAVWWKRSSATIEPSSLRIPFLCHAYPGGRQGDGDHASPTPLILKRYEDPFFLPDDNTGFPTGEASGAISSPV
jgi:hypothetical protein